MSTNIALKSVDATQLLPDYYPAVRVATAKDGVPQYTSIAAAHQYPQWQPNDHNAICVLVVDIDTDNWVLPFWEIIANNLDLMPSWFIEKRGNGHGQLGWIIEPVATGENARIHPITYANNVRYALTQAFFGDPNYVNSRCWNPTWDGWAAGHGDVKWGIIEPRPLGMLRDALQEAGLWVNKPRSFRPKPAPDRANAPGRNCHVFDVARQRTSGTVREAAQRANSALDVPLSPTELSGIIRSIERFEAMYGPPWNRSEAYSLRYMTDQQRQRLSERGRRGGLVNSDKQRKARAKGPQSAAVIRSAEAVGRAATALDLQQKGFTRNEIAKQMGAHPGTVKKWLRQARSS